MSKSEIHLEFLLEIFKGFSLGQTALQQLETILTNFVTSIKDLNITSSREPSTIDQTLIIHQVQRTNVSGDDSNPVWAIVPKTRLIYMHIDSKTWAWAMNKASESGFDFNMHNVIVDATSNVEKFLGAKDKLDKIFVYLTDKDLQQFGTDVTGTAVKSDQ